MVSRIRQGLIGLLLLGTGGLIGHSLKNPETIEYVLPQTPDITISDLGFTATLTLSDKRELVNYGINDLKTTFRSRMLGLYGEIITPGLKTTYEQLYVDHLKRKLDFLSSVSGGKKEIKESI